MKLKNTSAYLLAGFMFAACAGGGYQKTGNGVIVEVKQRQPTDVRKVRIEVMGEKLIHVSATPEKDFSKERSLMIVPGQGKTDFKVDEQGDEVAVKTSQVCATVSKVTGEVCFTDATGKRILAEDRRSFTPVEVEGTKGYSVRQIFHSADDEAFYGLGQHQADEFNYKGKMKNSSSIIRRYPYLSLCPTKTTGYSGTAIPCAVSVIHAIIHNWVLFSNCMIKRVRKGL